MADNARYLDARGVAAYLSISRAMVDVLVRRGKLPRPILLTPRLPRWDREAIDRAIAGAPATGHAGKSTSEIVRGIADGLAAERSARPKDTARR